MELCFHLFGVPVGIISSKVLAMAALCVDNYDCHEGYGYTKGYTKICAFSLWVIDRILNTLDQDVDSSAQPLNWKLIYLCSGLLSVVLKCLIVHDDEYSAVSQQIEIKKKLATIFQRKMLSFVLEMGLIEILWYLWISWILGANSFHCYVKSNVFDLSSTKSHHCPFVGMQTYILFMKIHFT